jgi:hypothetical protein
MLEKFEQNESGQMSNTYVIIAVVAVIAFAAAEGLGYIDFVPGFPPGEGNTRIQLAYVTESGEEIPIEGDSLSFYSDPDTLDAYASSDKQKKIDYLVAKMQVKVGSGTTYPAVSVDFDYESTSSISALNSSGANETVISESEYGNFVTLAESKVAVYTLERNAPSEGSHDVTWDLNVTATAGDSEETETASASAKATFYWEGDTLSITTSIDSGTMKMFNN